MNAPDIARLRELTEQLRGIIYGEEILDEAAAAIDALLDHIERAEAWPAAFERRIAIYRQKMEVADPFAKGDLNQFDKYQFVIEAYEYLAAEAQAGAPLAPPLDSNRIEGA